jgi:phospholipase/lecithinase/hemolysin
MLPSPANDRSFFCENRMNITRRIQLAALAALTAVLVTACGGGTSNSRIEVTRVVVAGDSLADDGTFGAKFTVQKAAAPAEGYPIYPELVAQEFGVDAQCNYFAFNGTTFVLNTQAGCTNYAVGGGRIVNPAAQGGASSPLSIPFQLATAANVIGTYGRRDLVVVDGGGNDAADLATAFLGATDPAGEAAYQNFLLQQIDAKTLAATLSQPNGPVVAGNLYMRNLADTFADAIYASVISKGARYVAVLNMPDITLTPRFQAVLAQVALANGGGTAGAQAAAQVQAVIRQWIEIFNTRLNARTATDTRIALVNFNADFTDEVNNPAKYGVTNVRDSACTVAGIADVRLCTDAALDANRPSGAPAGWWQTYAFSDGFHPTPLGHRLLADSVFRALEAEGWL